MKLDCTESESITSNALGCNEGNMDLEISGAFSPLIV